MKWIWPLFICLIFAGRTLAQQEEDEGRLFVLGFNTTLDFYHLDESREGLAPTSLAEWGLASGNISAALTADLSHLFETYSLDVNDDFDWGRFIHEASIKIQDIGGEPVALILGKQKIPFGQGFSRMPLPLFWNNPTELMREIRGVMGVTAKLSDLSNFQGLIDEAEVFHF